MRRQRQRLGSLLVGLERTVLSLARPARPTHGRILCYHSVGTPSWGINDVSPARFRGHIEFMLRAGRPFALASEIAGGQALTDAVALTFDDGLASVRNVLPMLVDYHVPFTVFVVTDWADRETRHPGSAAMSWADIEAIANLGGTIGSHSATHPNFGGISAAMAADELERSHRTIASRLGLAPTEFAIPFGGARHWNATAHQLALGCGYRTIYAACEDRRPAGTVGRTVITRWDSPRLLSAALSGKFDGRTE